VLAGGGVGAVLFHATRAEQRHGLAGLHLVAHFHPRQLFHPHGIQHVDGPHAIGDGRVGFAALLLGLLLWR